MWMLLVWPTHTFQTPYPIVHCSSQSNQQQNTFGSSFTPHTNIIQNSPPLHRHAHNRRINTTRTHKNAVSSSKCNFRSPVRKSILQTSDASHINDLSCRILGKTISRRAHISLHRTGTSQATHSEVHPLRMHHANRLTVVSKGQWANRLWTHHTEHYHNM